MDKLLQDLRFAVRSLRRQPGFVAVALATLALGIGTATAMFTVVNGVLLRPLPFHEPDNLTMIRIVGGDGMLFPLPDADFLALRANHPAFERVAVYAPTAFNLTGTGTPGGRAVGVGHRRLLRDPRRPAAARAVLRAGRRCARRGRRRGARTRLLDAAVRGRIRRSSGRPSG